MCVLIVEPCEILRMGIKLIFTGDKRVSDLYEAVTIADMKMQIQRYNPQLVVLNQSLVTTIKDLPKGNFVVLAATLNVEILKAAYKSGARGYLSENVAADLLRGMLNVAEGSFLIEPLMAPRIMANLFCDVHLSIQDELLTPREREVVELLREGIDRTTIAKMLHIAETTLKTHISNITRKSTKDHITEGNGRASRTTLTGC